MRVLDLIFDYQVGLELINKIVGEKFDGNTNLYTNDLSKEVLVLWTKDNNIVDQIDIKELTKTEALEEWEEHYPIFQELFKCQSFTQPRVFEIYYRMAEDHNPTIEFLLKTIISEKIPFLVSSDDYEQMSGEDFLSKLESGEITI